MQIEENQIKAVVTYNDSKTKRYSLKIEWDSTKKKLCIIMLSVSNSNGIYNDKTTNLVIKNAYELDYGSVEILNLFSSLDNKRDMQKDKEYTSIIDSVAKSSDTVIFAVGTGYKTDKRIYKRQSDVLATLKRYDKKLYCIADDEGKKFYHPLCPKVSKWNVVKFDVEELTRKGYSYD